MQVTFMSCSLFVYNKTLTVHNEIVRQFPSTMQLNTNLIILYMEMLLFLHFIFTPLRMEAIPQP